ncbi:hypothetical protein HPHPA20_1070 [Helicobacter pylori Hp A-20]|nr:hypothetical protein HPHPA20_1070 [Helicobacter pylori Hp A-20]
MFQNIPYPLKKFYDKQSLKTIYSIKNYGSLACVFLSFL